MTVTVNEKSYKKKLLHLVSLENVQMIVSHVLNQRISNQSKEARISIFAKISTISEKIV